MKIGIVTQQLHNNYGGLLQNYALQYVLKKSGHNVKTIDYVFRLPVTRYILSTCKQIILGAIRFKKPNIHHYIAIPSLRKSIISQFVDIYINKTKTVHSYNKNIIREEGFDIVITGSDQVWRPIYNYYIKDMYLEFVPDNVRKIAYAASFGVDSWEYTDKQTQQCAKLAKKLNAISVREYSGIDHCRKFLGVEAKWVVDPTILAGKEAYMPLIDKKYNEKYIFAYVLDQTPQKVRFINQIAKENGLDIRMHGSEKNATLSVEEWLSLIANSSIVITDSFHGTVFSILFHREFYSIVNKARGGSRFFSLLKPLGLECRVGDVEEIETSQIQNVDWKHIDNVLQKQREDSMNFLINALIK